MRSKVIVGGTNNMKPAYLRTSPGRRARRESGQTMTVVLLALGLCLLGAVGLSVDVSNWWFHRQIAQGAADAACTAGVMDMLVNAQGGSAGGLPVGSPPASFWCSAAPGAAPCQYASLNGYNGTGRLTGLPSNDVRVSFPGSVPGVRSCASSPPPCFPGANSFIQVDVLDRVQTTFTGLLSGSRTRDVAGSAVCGVLQDTAPVPIIVMNPTCPHAFQQSGSTVVKIVGGPTRSVQVNSNNSSCAAATTNAAGGCSSSGPTIDLSKGGPGFNGSAFGLAGQPTAPPPGFIGSSWGPASPISDPFAQVAAPTLPAALGFSTAIPYKDPVTNAAQYHGCPDHSGCREYHPGQYLAPIVVQGETAIFVPGVYYIKGTQNDNSGSPGSGCVPSPTGQSRYGLDVDSNGVVRLADPVKVPGDGSKGVMFYLSGTGAGNYGSVFFGSNAGKSGGRTVDAFTTANATCPGGSAPPPQLNLPSTVNGNVLLGQCTNKGTYIGTGSTDTAGTIRGLVFFQDRANGDAKGQASMQGGGGLVVSGNMYFHHCNASGTGTNCLAPPAGYKAFFQLQGNPGGQAYVLGNITSDELVLGGGGNISMALNPNAIYNILKASLLQ